MQSRRVGVVLSGCGVHDGSEIHESVLALLALDRADAKAVLAAPNVQQPQVIHHLTGEPSPYETRNARVEAARIARGPLLDLAEMRATDLDALLFPGGYGATKVLSDYAMRGRRAEVNRDVARLITEMHAARKPMLFLCTSPVLAARVLGRHAPLLTIGNDTTVAGDLEAWGAKHRACDARSIVVDREQRIVSSPAYMIATRIRDAAEGIDRAVRALFELI